MHTLVKHYIAIIHYMAKHYVAPPYAYTNAHIMPFQCYVIMVTKCYVYLCSCIEYAGIYDVNVHVLLNI